MNQKQECSRREFLGKALAATTAASAVGIIRSRAADETNSTPADVPASTEIKRKIRIGVIGLGGRGAWITGLFQQHGGFEIYAAADYFPDRVKEAGDRFGVDESRRFTGLSAYKRLIDSGVEAVAIESPPYFHPEQAAAAVDAGKHVYSAKPVAVDVPGCRTVESCGKLATEKKLAFLVDFQTRTDLFYIEAMRRVHAGGIGRLAFAEGTYHADSPWVHWYDALRNHPNDPETRLHAWGMDKILSGDIITEQNIHTLDVVNWLMGAPPLHAVGSCGLTVRPKIGSSADHFTCHFQFPEGAGVTFSSRQFNGYGTTPEGIRVRAFGETGVLETEYGGNVLIRGDNFYRGGKSPGIYEAGARANIATFYTSIVHEDYSNPTVAPSVQSNLITILGRAAAYSGELVTWKKLLAANEKLEADLSGLKD
jgi:myo-inositol 2-dehydrogenase/D-chiro-inositol 1-dehydrogenase